MVKPGLSRAIPASLLGAVAGVALVLLLRSLQQMEPLWDPAPALIMMAVITPITFLWGIGAFNPAMSEHAHPPDDDHAHDDHAEPESEPGPMGVLMSQMWNITGFVIVVLIILFGFATLPTGLRLDVTSDPAASFSEIGFSTWTIPFTTTEVELSQLTVFLGLIVLTIVSLLIVGGLLGIVFYILNRGVTDVQAEEN